MTRSVPQLSSGKERWLFLAAVLLLTATGCSSQPTSEAPPSAAALRSSSTADAAQGPQASAAAEKEPVERSPTYVLGTGRFVTKPSDRPVGVQAGTEGTQLNFIDADIRAVLSSILGEALGLSYTIDPSIKGTITVQSARPLQKDELLRALEAALSLQDIAVVEHDGSYDVVPMKDAPRKVTNLRLPNQTHAAGFGVQVVPLRYASAQEMSKILAPFASPGAIVRVDDARNLLVLSGTGQELASLLDIVQTFDVDWLSGMSYAFFPVSYVDAKTLVDDLRQVFDDQKSPLAGVVRLIPVSRLNTILVVSPQPDYLHRVGDWIKRLDLGGSSPGRRIYVYDVQNSKAHDLASTINQIFGISDTSSSISSTSSFSTSAQANRLGFAQAQPVESNLASVSPFQGGSAQLGQYAAPVAPTQTRGPVSAENAGLRLVADDATNSLVILATPGEFGIIDAAIKRLDSPPRQVLLEASLAEVTLNDDLKYGVEWFFKSGRNTVTFSPNSTGAVLSKFPGLSYLFSGSDISVVLNALDSVTHVKVLSAPKLLVLNNHEASIDVGDQVPILSQQAVSVSQSGAPIVNSVSQRDTGVILHITPRVNQGGMVILDIDQEVSTVVPTTTSNIDSPTIQERKISSTVAAHDGETIALGGLITETRSSSKDGIPFLHRIPVFGSLFGTADKSAGRTELIVLLKPSVMRDPDETREVMEQFNQEFQQLERQAGVSASGRNAKRQ